MNWRHEPGRPAPSGQRALRTCRPAHALTATEAWAHLRDADENFKACQGTRHEGLARRQLHDALDVFSEACFVDSLGADA